MIEENCKYLCNISNPDLVIIIGICILYFAWGYLMGINKK